MTAGLPAGLVPLEPPKTPAGLTPTGGMVKRHAAPQERIVQRLLGTDIDRDPQEWGRLATTAAGALYGGTVGARFPLNPLAGALVGSAIGAGLGAAAPEMLWELGENLGIYPPGTREHFGLGDEDLRTVVEGEMLLDLATGGGLLAARAGGRLFTTLVTKPGRAGRAVAETAAREGIAVLPVQVGQRTVPRQFVSVFGRFPWLATPMRRQMAETEGQLSRAFNSLGTRMGPAASMTDVSLDLFSDARQTVEATNTQFTQRFNALFARADSAGVRVSPTATIQAAEGLLHRIGRMKPKVGKGQAQPLPAAMTQMQKFLENDILAMSGQSAKGNQVFSDQTLTQMDTILTLIDEMGVKAARSGDQTSLDMLEELRNASWGDMLQNVRGTNAKTISQEFRALDQELTYTMQQLFETTAAKRFGAVRSRGLRGAYFQTTPGSFNSPTTTHVDQLARVILSGDSPGVVQELHRIVTQPTFNKLASHTLQAKLDSAFTIGDQGRLFNPDKFATEMGLNSPTGARYQQMSELLRLSGGLNMGQVEDLMKVAEAVRSVEMPNVSAFVARRTTMGGIRTGFRAMLPGLIATSSAGGAGVAAGGVMGGIVGAALFVGGSRLFSKMIANPASARAFSRALNEEASIAVRRAAGFKAIRLAMAAEFTDGAFGQEAGASERYHAADDLLTEMEGDLIKALTFRTGRTF